MALVHDYGVEPGERVQAQHLRPQLIVQDAGILQQQRLQLSREWDKNKYARSIAVFHGPNINTSPKCRLFLKKLPVKVLVGKCLSVSGPLPS